MTTKEDMDVRSPPLLEAEGRDVKFYARSVRILSAGFLGVFGGFQAAQGLQSSLNATLGFINLAALYGTFTILCLIAPTMLSQLEALVGFRIIMFASALTYVAMAVSNIYTKNWALPISMSVLVGIGAPLLWTCQNDYVGRCAFHATRTSQAAGQGAAPAEEADAVESDADRLAGNTVRFNSLFFSIYQFAGAGGNVVASVLMLAFSGKQWLKDVLFIVLGGVSLIGSLTFLLLPRVVPGEGQEEQPSLRATGALAIGDFRMRLMVPLMFTNGMTLAFLFGDYATDITCPVAGSSVVGFVAATFFFINSIATTCWGRLISSKHIRRRTAYIVATVLELVYLCFKLFWKRPDNYEHVNDDWNQVQTPMWSDYLAVFGMVALFACGDAFWESGPTATLQNFFLGTADCVPAMANYKLWQSLGFAVQFIIGATLPSHPEIRTGIIIALCVVSLLCVLFLDRLVSLQ